MKTNLIWAFSVLLLSACGGKNMAQMSSADAAYEPVPGEYSEEAMDGGAYAERSVSPESEDYGVDDAQLKNEAPFESLPPPAPPAKKQPAPSDKPNAVPEAPTDGPMIVYNGYLHLRVRRLMDALDEISKITKDNDGYVDSMTQRSIVVRIPGKNFEELLNIFAKLGDVLSREISAVEVTEQYTDLTSRLAVAKETRQRLLLLLEKVAEARERLLVLEEIKRLSEQIESIKSTLSTLDNLLKYFTVTIDLTPILKDDASIRHRSPFAWVRELSPHRTTLFGSVDKIQMKLPGNFVLFSKSDDYRAQAADTTIVRGGIVENDPRGDNTFWADAITYEMKGRSESLEESGKSGDVSWLLFKNTELQPRWYLIGIHVAGDKTYVLEVFFPNDAAFDAHKENLLEALETFEVIK